MSATSTEKTERRNPADDIKDNEQCEFLEEYLGEDWWDDLYNVGQTIDIRVYLWVVGLQMAVDQLTERGELTKED